MGTKLPELVAERIWAVLVANAGANPSTLSCDQFVYVCGRGVSEYRFCGALGSGGKVWIEPERWRVSCYWENETPVTKKIVSDTNQRLTELRKELGYA